MTPCSFLISPTALWPRDQRKSHPVLSLSFALMLSLPLSQHSLHPPQAFDLERMTEQFKINRAVEPAKEKHLLGWLQSNTQCPINIYPPACPGPAGGGGKLPIWCELLPFKSAISWPLWTRYQPIVCRRVNRSIYYVIAVPLFLYVSPLNLGHNI